MFQLSFQAAIGEYVKIHYDFNVCSQLCKPVSTCIVYAKAAPAAFIVWKLLSNCRTVNDSHTIHMQFIINILVTGPFYGILKTKHIPNDFRSFCLI